MSPEEIAEDVEMIQDDDEDVQVNDLMEAIPIVLKKALIHDGLVRGLREVAKALDGRTRKVHVCFLSSSCNEDSYKKLVEALCKASNIPLVMVPDSKKLGEWAGLCKIDKEGQPRKIVGASCLAITNYGEESNSLDFLQKHIATLATATA